MKSEDKYDGILLISMSFVLSLLWLPSSVVSAGVSAFIVHYDLIIGFIAGVAFIIILDILVSIDFNMNKLAKTRKQVKQLREDKEEWVYEALKHDAIIKELETLPKKGPKNARQDIALDLEESRIKLQHLKKRGCHKAQEKLDKIFERLGYKFDTEMDEEYIEKLQEMGAMNE